LAHYLGEADSMPTRCPQPWPPSPRHHVCFSVCRLAHVRGILKNVPHGLTGPDGLIGRGWRTGLLKSTADFGKTTAVSGRSKRRSAGLLARQLAQIARDRHPRGQEHSDIRTEHL